MMLLDLSGDIAKTEEEVKMIPSNTLSNTAEYYRNEAGRTYHAKGGASYVYPCDEAEYRRQKILHEELKARLNGSNWMLEIRLHSLRVIDPEIGTTRLGGPKGALDIGCGTGCVSIELADEFPHARVTGFDLVPSYPIEVPPNCHFLIDDVSRGLDYPADSFDFIYIRDLASGISEYGKLLAECAFSLRGGGILHVLEPAGFFSPSSTLYTSLSEFNELVKVLHSTVSGHGNVASKLQNEVELLKGICEVKARIVDIPLCASPKASGPRSSASGSEEEEETKIKMSATAAASMRESILLHFHSLSLSFQKYLGISPSRLESLERALRDELELMKSETTNSCDAVDRWIGVIAMKRI
ncbi:S-adenosyl-L-methionine-dependent methyltransferase [Atractiella rhizophila]|nr:S-adenosyl-L-methionine-dependent methyltransferase [Atractiella rhizophila]